MQSVEHTEQTKGKVRVVSWRKKVTGPGGRSDMVKNRAICIVRSSIMSDMRKSRKKNAITMSMVLGGRREQCANW